jgi:tape measure domain-containing protein
MAVSQATELKILVKTAGENNLDRLSRSLGNIGKNTVDTNFKFDKFSRSLLRTEQASTKSINTLRSYAASWREVANSVDIASAEFKKATAEAERLEKQVAAAQGKRGRGRLAQGAQIAGTIAGAGVFGGFEGAAGAGIGAIVGGVPGAITGGAIGAQVGQFRQALGDVASYSAELTKLRIALQGVTGDQNEYQRSLDFVSKTTRDFAIPTDILTREFTRLQASVSGAGGSVQDTEIAFKGIVAAVRATGGSIQDVNAALTATAQVFSKGKVSAEELRQQIGERLPGAFTLFAEAIGLTPQELDKALEGGKVSLNDFQVFAEKLFERYGETAQIIASSPSAAGDRLDVAMKALKEKIGPTLADIGASFQNFAAEAIKALSGVIDKLAELGRQFEARFGGSTLENAKKNLERQGQIIDRFNERVKAGLQLTDKEKQDLKLAQRLYAGSLQVVEGAKLGPPVPSAPSKLPGAGDERGGAKEKTRKQISTSKELLDLGLRRNQVAEQGNTIESLRLNYLFKERQIRELLDARAIDANTAQLRSSDNLRQLQEAIGRLFSGFVGQIQKAGKEQETLNKSIEDQAIKLGVITEQEAKILQATRQLQELEPLRGLISQDKLELFDKIIKKLNEIKTSTTSFGKELGESFQEGIKTMGELSQNLGSALAGAFGGLSDQLADFITTGKASFAEFTQSVLQDLARIFVRFAMFNALKGVFQGTGFLGFADGGIMTKNGAMPLKRYARGGIANSPQLAMFGEGSMPEAYVPLPDGRSIPVSMKNGGAGTTNVVVNVDAGGTNVQGDAGQAQALGKAVSEAVQAEIIKQKRPGGLLS